MALLYSLDIETACNVEGCTDSACSHALDPYRNKITVIGVYASELQAQVFRNLSEFKAWDELHQPAYVGFNLKFDLSVLAAHGVTIPLDRWADDALLMATAFTQKIPLDYLDAYEARRRELNTLLPKGKGHRKASFHSLKTLAPYFLGVEPFWEATLDHDNDEYVLKDAEYTYRLWELFTQELQKEGSYKFYKEKLFEWTKLLYKMEQRGIEVDLELIRKLQVQSNVRAEEIKQQLDNAWYPAYAAYFEKQKEEVVWEYTEKLGLAVAKLKEPNPEKNKKLQERYEAMANRAIEKIPREMNLDSPAQLKWLLQTYFKLDITDFHDDESTGKPVLKRLAADRDDIKLFLEYRAQRKLATAFYPSYLDMQVDGVIHAKFNPFIARTGRLSSSYPNLQQVPKDVHAIFKARKGYVLITKDQAAIEPRLIAYATEDKTLFDIFDHDEDFHGHNTKIFFGLEEEINSIKKNYPLEREVGKEVGLAILYGAGGMRFQESCQKRGFNFGLNECKAMVKEFRAAYPDVIEFKESLDSMLKRGEIVHNLFGRPFRIPDVEDVHMQGFNTLIQGSASDLVLNSAWRMQAAFEAAGIDAHVLLLVHDEIVVEAREEDAEMVATIMDEAMTDYKLETRWGRVELKTEGKTSTRWEK